MVKRNDLDLEPAILKPAPNLAFDNTGQQLEAKAKLESLGKLNVVMNEWADKEAIMAGTEDGLKAGMTPNFKPLRGTGLYSQAFDQAGIDTYANEVQIKANADAARIFTEHKQDPITLQKALSTSAEATMSALPDEVKPRFKQLWAASTLQYTDQARQIHEAKVLDQLRASSLVVKEASENNIYAAARTIEDDEQAAAAIAAQVAILHNQITSKTVGSSTTPLYTEEQKAKFFQDLDKNMFIQRSLGKLERAQDKRGFLNKFEETARASGEMSPEVIDKTAAEMRSIISQKESGDSIRNARLTSNIETLSKAVENNYVPDPAQINEIKTAAQDNPAIAQKYATLEYKMAVMPGYNAASPNELQDHIHSELIPAATKDGATVEEIQRLNIAQEALAAKQTAITKDPVEYVSRANNIPVAPLFGQDKNGGLTINQQELANRNTLRPIVQDRTGKNFAFLDTEINYIRDRFNSDNVDPSKAMTLLSAISAPLDNQTKTVLATQLNEKSPEIAGALMADNPTIAHQIIAGSKSTYKIPESIGNEIQGKLGIAILDEKAREAAIATVKADYRYHAFRNTADPAAVDSDLLDKAMSEVVGPIVTPNRNSQVISYQYNGKRVTEDEFDDVVSDARSFGDDFIASSVGSFPYTVKNDPVPPGDILKHGTWVTLSDGKYQLNDVAGDPFHDKNGKPYVIDMPKLQADVEQKRIGNDKARIDQYIKTRAK